MAWQAPAPKEITKKVLANTADGAEISILLLKFADNNALSKITIMYSRRYALHLDCLHPLMILVSLFPASPQIIVPFIACIPSGLLSPCSLLPLGVIAPRLLASSQGSCLLLPYFPSGSLHLDCLHPLEVLVLFFRASPRGHCTLISCIPSGFLFPYYMLLIGVIIA